MGCDAEEIVFGANMTSLTFAMSRSIGRELNAGDEIVVTRLDHDANYSPWLALEERGVTVRVAEIHDRDCTLDMHDLARKITSRTKLVAVGYASNAVGTINDVREVVRMAHRVGPWLTSMRFITRRTAQLMCARSIATFSSALRTNFSDRTWACCLLNTST